MLKAVSLLLLCGCAIMIKGPALIEGAGDFQRLPVLAAVCCKKLTLKTSKLAHAGRSGKRVPMTQDPKPLAFNKQHEQCSTQPAAPALLANRSPNFSGSASGLFAASFDDLTVEPAWILNTKETREVSYCYELTCMCSRYRYGIMSSW